MCKNKNFKLSMLLLTLAFIANVLAIPTTDARGTGHQAGSGSHGGGHRGHTGGHQGNHAGHRHFGSNHQHSDGNQIHFGGLHSHTGHHAGFGLHGGGHGGHIGGHQRNHAGHRHFGGNYRFFGRNQIHFGDKRNHNNGMSRNNSRHNYNYYRYGYSVTPNRSYRPYSPYRPRHNSLRSYLTNIPTYSSPTPYINIKAYPSNDSSDTNTHSNNLTDTRNSVKNKEIKVINNAEVNLLATDIEWNAVSACLSNKKSCNCYGHSGNRLAIPKESCELAAKYGWPQKTRNRS